MRSIIFSLILFLSASGNVVTLQDMTVVIAAEEGHLSALEAISTAIKEFRSRNFRISEVRKVILTEDTTEDEICNQIFSGHSSPSLMFDTTLMPLITGSRSSSLIKRYTRKTGLPTFSTGYAFGADRDEWDNLDSIERQILIRVNQPGDIIPLAVKDIALNYNVTSAVIFYDRSFVLDHKVPSILENTDVRYVMKAIDADIEESMEEIRNAQITSYFVLAGIRNINKMLEIAGQKKMFGINHSWYLITKSRGKIKCENCTHGSVMFYQPSRARSIEYNHLTSLVNVSNSRKVDAFFHYDLARFVFQTIDELIVANHWPEKLDYPACGLTMSNAQREQRKVIILRREMSMDGFYGLFGRFDIDDNPEDENPISYQETTLEMSKIELWNYQPFKYIQVGDWMPDMPSGRFVFTAGLDEASKENFYRIVTIVQPPFIMKHMNGTWYGYCIDLLKHIRERMKGDDKFQYEIYEVPDGKYGTKNKKTGEWNGIIGELQKKRAQIAVGSVSVMAERESVVDFTVPYYDLVGISILMKRAASSSHLFKFLTVLDNNVWYCILVAYVITSTIMFIFDRLSPYSYHNNQEALKDDPEKRDFNWKECLWFCMTSLTPQGGGEAPHNLSGRIVAAAWWLFGFIVIASYTANLAAFLTVSRLDSPIDSLDKLAEQYRIKYAAEFNTQAMVYFERMAYIEQRFYDIWKKMSLDESSNPMERAKLAVWDYPISHKYTRIWKQMHLSGMPRNFDIGVWRVKQSQSAQEGFAFIAEATKIKYAAMTNCDLQQVGNEFSRKPLALAVQEGSPLKDKLSSAILQLLNQRKLESLKETWWNNNPETKKCEDPKKTSDGISINNIGGVFVVIFVGVLLACITLAFEYIFLRRKKKSTKTDVRMLRGSFPPYQAAIDTSTGTFARKPIRIGHNQAY